MSDFPAVVVVCYRAALPDSLRDRCGLRYSGWILILRAQPFGKLNVLAQRSGLIAGFVPHRHDSANDVFAPRDDCQHESSAIPMA